MSRAVQKQIERSKQARSGSKRVEAVLGTAELSAIEKIKNLSGKDNAAAVRFALRFTADALVSGK
jgi:hypothetical protein